MARYLLDTDVLIWVLRNRRETVDLLSHLSEESGEAPACSALSILEVWSGIRTSEIHKTGVFLDALQAIPIDGVVARQAAELLRASKRHRNPREWIDALIAATVLRDQRILVTYNRKDYPYPNLVLYPL
jgi:predicted nucleic acid-binding protein